MEQTFQEAMHALSLDQLQGSEKDSEEEARPRAAPPPPLPGALSPSAGLACHPALFGPFLGSSYWTARFSLLSLLMSLQQLGLHYEIDSITIPFYSQ